MDTTNDHKQSSQRIVRHPEYYIYGGDIIFRVEDTLFRVHRYFFTRESAFFRSKLPHPPPPGDFSKGYSDAHPLVLEDALEVDFERFLWVFYNPKYSLYDATAEEWTSIVKLAHQWDFTAIKALAVRELERLAIPPLQKIAIYHRYLIDRTLLRAAYAAFATRVEPITIEEGRELGLETTLQLARARELARAPASDGRRIKDGHAPVNVAGAGLDELIQDVFQLPPPEQNPDRHVTPRKPIRKNTITNAHADKQSGTQPNGASSNDPNSAKGTGNTPNVVANGHVKQTPDGVANAQANGAPNVQAKGRANGK